MTAALVSGAFAYFIGTHKDPKSDTVEFEFYKLLIQALLIVAVGACLSAAIQEGRRRREARERLRDLSRNQVVSILRDVEEDYQLIKRSRKMLRLEKPIRHPLYRTEMLNLEDIRRSLDEVLTNLEVLEFLTEIDLVEVRRGIEGMKIYLGQIWEEYEQRASRTNEEFAATELKELSDFVEKFERGSFARLWSCHRDARSGLIKELARLAVDSRVSVSVEGGQ